MPIQSNNKTFLNVNEAAVESGRAKQTIYQNHKRWGWTVYEFGGNILFDQEEIRAWLLTLIKPKAIH